MTALVVDGPVLVMASESTSREWAERLESFGVPARALPWSTIGPGPDCERANDLLRVKGGDRSNPRRIVLLTSKNAALFLPVRAGVGWQAMTVGPETARAAIEAGFTVDAEPVADEGAGFASVARGLIARLGHGRRAIWLRGESAHRDGVELLKAAGWIVAEFVTYRAEPRIGFEASVHLASGARAWVVGSPAAARALIAAFGTKGFPPPLGQARVFVRGETTADVLRLPGRAIPEIVADLPNGLPARLSAPPPRPS